MNTKYFAVLVLLSFPGAITAQTAAEPDSSKVQAAVEANDKAYEAAYAKGDAKALADFFTEDAEYTADDGNVIVGRAAIEQSIARNFLSRKGATLGIAMSSVRPLGPAVVLEKGTTTVTSKNGETDRSAFTAIYVKQEDKWRISQLIESPVPDPSAHDQLTQLAWLIGNWAEADKGEDLTVDSQYVWARGGNFITRNITVKRAGETTLEGWQVIGWDAAAGNIRSWTFDGEGGFSEGTWTREGDRWLVQEKGVTPDGSQTTAENTFTKISDDRFAWESANRTLDGQPQPGIGRIEINRAKSE